MSGAIWIGIWILFLALALELLAPEKVAEGFAAVTLQPAAVKSNILTNMIPRRADEGPGYEESGYIQDRRYFNDYTDVQRYGVKNDFCRVMLPSGGKEDDAFFACALGGTKGVNGHSYYIGGQDGDKEPLTVKKGLKLSRDDYMNELGKDGRESYCRILRQPSGLFLPMCFRAGDFGFTAKEVLDPSPPDEIQRLLEFYAGCQLWYRFRDDMNDYVGKTFAQLAGGISIDETPRPPITRGVLFNGKDQFIRIGDTSELSLGNKVMMRTIRAFSVWVNFNEFTNNAHIFDFGDGPGLNNTFLGILGRGDAGEDLRPGSDCPETTVPTGKSGAQFCPEIRPQQLLEETSANVDEYTCPGFQQLPRRMEPIRSRPPAQPGSGGNKATLLFEIWDKKLRKAQIKVNRAIPLKRWTHIVITAKNNDVMRPALQVYVNGELLYTLENGCLPAAKVTSNNYFGKSNWTNDFSEYELRDELFSGQMFDFRMYSTPLAAKKIEKIQRWGAKNLGLED